MVAQKTGTLFCTP